MNQNNDEKQKRMYLFNLNIYTKYIFLRYLSKKFLKMVFTYLFPLKI
jgi:hypothetical protein